MLRTLDGHWPRTLLSEIPANTAAQWPGTNGTVQYSEGLDVGYRWYDANNVTPLFPWPRCPALRRTGRAAAAGPHPPA
jgi:hypothetical protein